jgi:Ca2+/Na+ antiporter
MSRFLAPFKTKKYWRQYAIALVFFFIAVVFLIILMRNTSLANAIVAFGTLILALITTFSIINANYQAKRDRKERWINEIIEWAINIINWRSENKGVFRDIKTIKSPEEQRLHKYAHIIELTETLAGMRGRNQYAEKITFQLSASLHGAVEKLIKGVEEYIKMLDDWQRAIAADIALADDKDFAGKAAASERQVGELADKVIEEATKIKTRNVG